MALPSTGLDEVKLVSTYWCSDSGWSPNPTHRSEDTPAPEPWGVKSWCRRSTQLFSTFVPPSPPQHLSVKEGIKDFKVTAGYSQWGWGDFSCEITLSKCLFGRWCGVWGSVQIAAPPPLPAAWHRVSAQKTTRALRTEDHLPKQVSAVSHHS